MRHTVIFLKQTQSKKKIIYFHHMNGKYYIVFSFLGIFSFDDTNGMMMIIMFSIYLLLD